MAQLLARLVLPTQELVARHPPKIKDRNKRLVADIALSSAPHGGTLTVSRYGASALPATLAPPSRPLACEMREDIFTYDPGPGMQWHVNFADLRLFCGYAGPLLAQDELQAAEHPALGSVREALLSLGDPSLQPLTRDGDAPTPILIRGVERRCILDTRPSRDRPLGLYGNRFSRADPDEVKAATRPIHPPSLSNILAMEAIPGGRGAYTQAQIKDVLLTAFTGFGAARLESIDAHGDPLRTRVHTGHWGTGAYGGNRELMALLQLIAARLAGLDALVYHTVDAAGTAAYREAFDLFNGLTGTGGESLAEIISRIEQFNYRWGTPDGN